ncbi:hypothetical protein Tsubulata_041086 [Turnera subulata]|uniref:Ataxin-2 C-terminal domain-containing protein n=1 Tax=Turnera subulata TaxID=218843 RepID=A0A9Q0J845_9ROSI|nr:hypothetical protein Tsubulata_041086 [Turnera subulata]
MGAIVAGSSTLNPNAPLFVPLAYRTVEDFSDQWWALVQSSSWFRDYWLQERFHDPQTDPASLDILDPALLLDCYEDDEEDDEFDSLFFDEYSMKPNEEVEEVTKDLVRVGSMKWQKGRAQAPRFVEKAPKIVNVKVSPRTIQQPR